MLSRVFILLLLPLSLWAADCQDDTPSDAERFQKANPYSVSICSSHVTRTKASKSESPSHSSMIIHGAAIDKDASGRRILRLAKEGEAPEGVGLTAAAYVSNARMLLVPGDMFNDASKHFSEYKKGVTNKEMGKRVSQAGILDNADYNDDWIVDMKKIRSLEKEFAERINKDLSDEDIKAAEKIQKKLKGLEQVRRLRVKWYDYRIKELSGEKMSEEDKKAMKEVKKELDAVVASTYVGWDFYQAATRDMVCVRVPLSQKQVEKVIDQANELNHDIGETDLSKEEKLKRAKLSKKVIDGSEPLTAEEKAELEKLNYNNLDWNAFANNCVVPVSKSVAGVTFPYGLCDNKPLARWIKGSSKMGQVLAPGVLFGTILSREMALPGSYLLDTVARNMEMSLNPLDIYADSELREDFLKNHESWTPMQYGTQVFRTSMLEPNDAFEMVDDVTSMYAPLFTRAFFQTTAGFNMEYSSLKEPKYSQRKSVIQRKLKRIEYGIGKADECLQGYGGGWFFDKMTMDKQNFCKKFKNALEIQREAAQKELREYE